VIEFSIYKLSSFKNSIPLNKPLRAIKDIFYVLSLSCS
jgi:hypothetical protein